MSTKVRDQDVEFIKKLLGDDVLSQNNTLNKKSLCKIKEAYNRSHDIRKFEIDLYWKRATYFWAFITTITAIFGLCIKDKDTDYFILSPIIANIGFITALCFYYANLGSKYWQENWEHNVDNLEFYVSGNLYKINYYNDTGIKYSVSRVNNELSFLLCFIWFFIFIGSLAYISFNSLHIDKKPFLIIILTLIFCISFVYIQLKLPEFIGGKHDKGYINYYVRPERKSKFKEN